MMYEHDSITPYAAADTGKKEQVSAMFNNIANRYDLLNRLLSFGIDRSWRKAAIRHLAPLDPQQILDIATGTADLAIAAAKSLKPQRVVGIDIADKMLEVGRKKIIREDLSHILSLEQGDAENLNFPSASFDAATVAFGVRNFEHLEAGLREMHRVLRPGATIAILEFSRPQKFPLKQLYRAYFRYLLPTVGRFTSRDPKAYRYLYDSAMAFPDGERFLEILRHTGFKQAKCKQLSFGICSLYTASA